MSAITNKWNDGSEDSITIESSSFIGNQTISISSPVQIATVKRSIALIGKCVNDASKTVTLTVEQLASDYTYEFSLAASNTTLAAGGGEANITATLKTFRNGGLVSTESVTPVLSGEAEGFTISGTKVTAANRAKVVGADRSITVTGTFSGTFDKQTVEATIVIKQAANAIESYNYGTWTITISASPTTISRDGGTSEITANCTRSKTPVYTSGATGTADSESATPTLSCSGAGFSLEGTTVTATKNTGGARSCTVTAAYSGATSETCTINQEAGLDGIGYMQIEGDGVSHPIFRVG